MKKTIKQLEADNAEVMRQYQFFKAKSEAFEQRMRNLTEIVFEKNNNRFPAHPDKSWEDVVNEVVRLKATVTSEGQAWPHVNSLHISEKQRLWYLLRILAGEKNVKEPIDQITRTSVFGVTFEE